MVALMTLTSAQYFMCVVLKFRARGSINTMKPLQKWQIERTTYAIILQLLRLCDDVA